ncbi:DUF4442 domain-containing protein [soil metagenome]
MFLLGKLPSAFFSGVKLKYIDEQKAVASVPYKWFSQNPFKSTYFACLAMAAELSTGLLGMLHTYNTAMPVSMLVVGLEAKYYKKATGITIFTCNDGDAIKNTIDDAFQSGEGRSIKATSSGVNSDGELVAEFFVIWSFKVKSPRP